MTDTFSGPTGSRRVNISDYWNDKAARALSVASALARDTSQSITITEQGVFGGSSATSATPVSARLSLTERRRTERRNTFSTFTGAGCPIHWWNPAAPNDGC